MEFEDYVILGIILFAETMLEVFLAGFSVAFFVQQWLFNFNSHQWREMFVSSLVLSVIIWIGVGIHYFSQRLRKHYRTTQA